MTPPSCLCPRPCSQDFVVCWRPTGRRRRRRHRCRHLHLRHPSASHPSSLPPSSPRGWPALGYRGGVVAAVPPTMPFPARGSGCGCRCERCLHRHRRHGQLRADSHPAPSTSHEASRWKTKKRVSWVPLDPLAGRKPPPPPLETGPSLLSHRPLPCAFAALVLRLPAPPLGIPGPPPSPERPSALHGRPRRFWQARRREAPLRRRRCRPPRRLAVVVSVLPLPLALRRGFFFSLFFPPTRSQQQYYRCCGRSDDHQRRHSRPRPRPLVGAYPHRPYRYRRRPPR